MLMLVTREEDIRELVRRAELVVGENQFLKSQLEMKQSVIDNLKNEFLKSKHPLVDTKLLVHF